jgi:integrase
MPGEIGLWRHPVNKRYYVTWTVGTRSNRITTGETDRGKAEEFRATFVLERNAGQPAKAAEVEIRTLLDSYIDRHAKGLPSEERLRIAAKHLKAHYKSSHVSAISARNHERYIAECRAEGKAAGTINRRLGVLRAALRFAVKSGDLQAAPYVPSLREPPSRPHVLTTKQLDTLLAAAKASKGHAHVETFIQIASQTGARRTAILQLTWDRVDLDAATIDFRLPGVAHTRKRRAITGISAGLVAYLAALRKRTKGTNVVQFRGEPVESIKRAFAYVADKAKLPHVTPHVLKHTFVSQALQVASPWVVSGMTATSIRTLQAVYGKHMVEDQKKAAEAMAHLTRKSRAKTSSRTKGRNGVKR